MSADLLTLMKILCVARAVPDPSLPLTIYHMWYCDPPESSLLLLLMGLL
jgi:hypothetical protein